MTDGKKTKMYEPVTTCHFILFYVLPHWSDDVNDKYVFLTLKLFWFHLTRSTMNISIIDYVYIYEAKIYEQKTADNKGK